MTAARLVILTLLGAYAVLLIVNTSLVAGGTDSSGYLNEARLIASGRTRLEPEQLRSLGLGSSMTHAFTPLGFKPDGRNIVPMYPPGLPLRRSGFPTMPTGLR